VLDAQIPIANAVKHVLFRARGERLRSLPTAIGHHRRRHHQRGLYAAKSKRRDSQPSNRTKYTYDSGPNGKGRLTGASDANHSMTWAYDALGRVSSKKQTQGSVNQTVGYTYSNADLTTLTTPSGQTVTYTYSDGLVASIAINGTTLLSSVAYEPFGPVRGWTWGNSTTTEVRLYNTDGNPSQYSAIESTTLAYDNAFRITGTTNASNSALSWTYGYDLLDRLSSAAATGTTRGWTFDTNGNRLTQTGTVAGTYTPSSSSNRLSSITGTPARTYSYDSAGNTLTYSTTTFTYWNRGRMKTAKVGSSTTTYYFNVLGQRIKKTGGSAGTVLMVYDETGHLLGEYSSTGALVQETVWLGDTPVATIRPNGSSVSVYYVHADHRNAPQMVTRPSDNKIAWRWDTDPYGTTAPNQNPQSLGTFVYNLRYPGQYYDSETGLFYNYFRDYDPQTGRYVESDPIGLRGGSYSTYAYASGNPVSDIDPFGLCDNCVPRPMVSSWICALLSVNDFNVRRAAHAAYNLREANNGANDNSIFREGENWLTAAAFDRWYDPQAYVMNIYLWQYTKYIPGVKESYSQDALNAGLDGHKHGNSSEDDMKNAEDLKKWCKNCGKQ
jgi:RHS repeat-associated protein